ncbi:MAG TPA: flagellar hook capping FlgD N-terminal domain-containing protein [Gemmataceae bacterium]|nr:flagellar hook capping FlgD N-terminal domain-containing protein [Gemmataceae bacterium]
MSSLSPLTAASLNANSVAASTSSAPSQSKNTIDFMKLLTAQMQNQNPLDPQNANDFTTQIAQLQQVDGINQLNQSISSLVAMQSISQGANLIGMKVTYTNNVGGSSQGVVSSVAMLNGKAQLMVNGAQVDLSQVKTIEAGPSS